jgi:gas vesicle protein
MKKYIENIRVSVKKSGYTPTSDQIRQAINIVCPDGVDILENKAAIVNETIKIITGATLTDNTLSNADELTITTGATLPDSNLSNNEETLLPTTVDTHVDNDVDRDSSEIVVSEEEKHDLITSQASVLGFTLSEEEATSIAETVDEIFDSYNHLIDSISIAIKAYFDNKFDSVESRIGSNSENLREHFADRKERLNKKIADFKDDVKADLGGIRNDIKSVQSAFTRRLAIPVKT